MRGPSDFFFSGKKPFQQLQPEEVSSNSGDSSEHPKIYKEVLGQIEKKMELQIKKIFDRIDELKRGADYRFRNIKHQLEVTEARVEELHVQLNMLSAKQSAA